MKWLLLFCLGGCIISPTPLPVTITVKPTAGSRTPAPPPAITPVAGSGAASIPAVVNVNEPFEIYFAANEDSTVYVWVDKNYPLGIMDWDDSKKEMNMAIRLNTAGRRSIDFKINDAWVFLKRLEVKN